MPLQEKMGACGVLLLVFWKAEKPPLPALRFQIGILPPEAIQ